MYYTLQDYTEAYLKIYQYFVSVCTMKHIHRYVCVNQSNELSLIIIVDIYSSIPACVHSIVIVL